MATGKIGITSENIFPVIKKFLYSEQEIFLRELVSNAVDATTKVKALARKGELKEELAIDVNVGNFLCTVDYDYPSFHLTMHCFYCSVVGGELTLLEHEAAKWLNMSELHSVNWLPADVEVVSALERNR